MPHSVNAANYPVVCDLSCFVTVDWRSILSIPIRFTLLALGKSYDYTTTNDTTLVDNGRCITRRTIIIHIQNKAGVIIRPKKNKTPKRVHSCGWILPTTDMLCLLRHQLPAYFKIPIVLGGRVISVSCARHVTSTLKTSFVVVNMGII